MALVQPIADYKLYVARTLDKLVTDTKAFTAAVKAGDVEKAKALFAPTRINYEAIEPIAELFSDLDGSIDSRADDHEQAEKDPALHRLPPHRIRALDRRTPPRAWTRIADKLMADVNELHDRIAGLMFPPDVVVGGAAALMEEVAATKISGEEDRYSHTDLWDFQANIDGSQEDRRAVQPAASSRTTRPSSRRSTPISPPSTPSSPSTRRRTVASTPTTS